MKLFTLAFLLVVTATLNGQIKNPFLTLKFDKVIICDYENDGEHDYPLVDGKGNLTSIVNKNAQLRKYKFSHTGEIDSHFDK